jgi:hypothetical protein
MKITKKNLAIYKKLYEAMMNRLIFDLSTYKLESMAILEEHDMKHLDNETKEGLEELCKMFFLNRISEFNGDGNAPDLATSFVQKLLNGE